MSLGHKFLFLLFVLFKHMPRCDIYYTERLPLWGKSYLKKHVIETRITTNY